MRLRKSFRLPGGGRINVSSRGVSTSWGVGGLRVRVGPGGSRKRNRSSRSSSGGGPSPDGRGCLFVLLAIAAAMVLGLVVKVLMTPWPWIALGVYAAYALGRRFLALIAGQRKSFAVLEVVAAQLDGDGSRLERSLSRLGAYADDDAEAALLLSAHYSWRNQFDAAIGLLRSIEGASAPELDGHGLVLRFPGIPVPLALAELPSAQEVARLLREYLTVRSGRASELLATVRPTSSPALAPLAAWTLAEAYCTLSRHESAVAELQRIVYAASPPPTAWIRPLRSALARALELAGASDLAIDEWRHLAECGDADARAHLHAALTLRAERHREEEMRREAERRAHAALEEQKRRESEARAAREASQREAEREQARALAEARRAQEAARREAEREAARVLAEARRAQEAAQREAERAAAAERAARDTAQRELAALVRWTAKIRSAKTPAGRRSALQSGLADLTSPDLRQELLIEAARADVEAVLTKTTTLKTERAKRRHLEEALAALRSDAVADEVQAQEIALLERALADLGGPA